MATLRTPPRAARQPSRGAPPISPMNGSGTDASSMPLKCNICIKSKPIPFAGSSTYASEYVKHPLPATPSKTDGMPSAPVPPAIPFTAKSTYEQHYPGHRVVRPPQLSFAPPPKEEQPVPFLGESSYHRDYVRHPLPSAPPGRAAPIAEPERIPFTAGSTYSAEFTGHQIQKPSFIPSEPPLPQPHVPFEGTSTYASEFTRKPLDRVQPQQIRPSPASEPSIPFAAESTYSSSYVQHRLPAPQQILQQPDPCAEYECHRHDQYQLQVGRQQTLGELRSLVMAQLQGSDALENGASIRRVDIMHHGQRLTEDTWTLEQCGVTEPATELEIVVQQKPAVQRW